MKKEKKLKITGDFETYPENPKKNAAASYVAQKKLLKRIMGSVDRERFKEITNREIEVDDFQDSSATEKAYSESYRIEVEDRLMSLTKDELVEINKVAPKHTAEWIVKKIFERRIRRTKI